MNSTIINFPPLLLIPELACAIGINESLVLQQLHYWIQKNEAAGTNLRDDRYWTYGTIDYWLTQFPFWSKSTLTRTFSKLKKRGLIVSTRKYNKAKSDNTNWHSIIYENVRMLENQIQQMHLPKSANGDTKIGKSIESD